MRRKPTPWEVRGYGAASWTVERYTPAGRVEYLGGLRADKPIPVQLYAQLADARAARDKANGRVKASG